ncbi:MAG: sugar ABC transporter ATP-binding protein [Deltaproteobacteria bacterium]|nr:sugar ABC transporter ATP-binding protein [Deltaproteobacteria bacterium]
MPVISAARPDAGRISAGGRAVELRTPADAYALGIATIYQDPQLISAQSVAANILLGRPPLRRVFGLSIVDRLARRRRAGEILARLQVELDPDRPIRSLTVAEKQIVEIAKALATEARVLVMDEPTASLVPREIEALFGLIRKLRDEGVAVVFVSHKVDEVLALADRVTVLRDGRVVGAEPVRALTAGRLIRLIVGRELQEVYPRVECAPGGERLAVDALRLREGQPALRFSLRQGEVVALTGLLGAGCSEVLKALYGARQVPERRLRLGGEPVEIRAPHEALERGMGYVPEDRKEEGIIPTLSVQENIALACLGKVTRFGFLSRQRMARLAAGFVRVLGVKTPSLTTPVGHLSGGNQQKVLMARMLATDASLLALDEPTHGIDVGTKAEIHRLVGRFVQQGGSVLVASSELPEVLGAADRVLVMRQGILAGELQSRATSQEAILRCAAGLGTDRPA